MGLMDKAKGLIKGREEQVKRGIDTVSDQVERRAGKHADKVSGASQKAKQAVDSLTGRTRSGAPAAGPHPPSTPPASTTNTAPPNTDPTPR